VRTDTLFYQILQTFPQLVNRPVIPGYTFTSVEVKETGFRFDGIFLPPDDLPKEPIYFIEVQFQTHPDFYHRFLSEIFLFLYQQKTDRDWLAVAIFPTRTIDRSNLALVHQEMIQTGRIRRIYLDEINDRSSVEMQMLNLITCPPEEAVKVVNEIRSIGTNRVILEFIETILVYKFPKLSRKEIERMFALDDLRQTRVYQETLEEGIQMGKQEGIQIGKQEGIQIGKQEGRREGEISLVMRLIRRKFGQPDQALVNKISNLTLEQLENLGEELLDFTTIDDLRRWLENIG
jgi:predicted transposase/invertase (TIGR01784 family)